MTNRIPAEWPPGSKIGSVLAFPPPAGLPRKAVTANLNGLQVALRWHGDDIAAVIFTDPLLAAQWPSFEADQ
jgi:hypothetical protein